MLATYADLVSAIGAWLKRTDLADRIPDFIRLTEARVGRLLTDPDMQVTTTVTLTGRETTLPTDIKEIIAIGAQGFPLRQATASEFAGIRDAGGSARIYAVSAGKLLLAPSQFGDMPITYARAIPALTAASPTNWLMTRAPDVYLYGSLLEAEFYGWNDERLETIKIKFDEALGELRVDGERRRWGSAPLAPRLGRT